MPNKVHITNPQFAKDFITSIILFSQDAKFVFRPEGTTVNVLCQSLAGMKAEFFTNSIRSDAEVSLCMMEIQRFQRAISMVTDVHGDIGQIDLDVSSKEDFLIYDGGSLKFKIGMVNEKAISNVIDPRPFIDIESKLTQKFIIDIPMDKLKNLFKQAAIVRSKDPKIYLVMNGDHSVSAQLEDKSAIHCGMVTVPIADVCIGEFTPIILAVPSVHCLTKLPGDSINFMLSQQMIILAKSEFQSGEFEIKAKILFTPTRG